ncbi:hypothetical protein LAZ67_3001018 [Cordylochernes scorpioides]|uniref:MyTH4 domain-containing protein n=1 Tax=Cordylochernes scorpioides TaxID=51811 RepID=A0ABY6K6K6_9ARAC|nr:hypothetical protein LAZ67_3001018 [Cordylochernes scorpioides]
MILNSTPSLKICSSCVHRNPGLRDELYCQIMKQTTNNKSSKPDSCIRGWRLFSMITAYFQSSEGLKPYLFKYLETAAYDTRRAYHGTARVCLHNLRKTYKYGGRKNVPGIEEVAAISAGRNHKRQMFRIPGGSERVVNTKSTTVVQDVIEEMCSALNVRRQQEMDEFSLYCVVDGDPYSLPLGREEYILDVTTEIQKEGAPFYLIFCRSVWVSPVRLDNVLSVEVAFNQVAPDYLEGLLLEWPVAPNSPLVLAMARGAALLQRASGAVQPPHKEEIRYLIPKPAVVQRDISSTRWQDMVNQSWEDMAAITPTEAKAQFLGKNTTINTIVLDLLNTSQRLHPTPITDSFKLYSIFRLTYK